MLISQRRADRSQERSVGPQQRAVDRAVAIDASERGAIDRKLLQIDPRHLLVAYRDRPDGLEIDDQHAGSGDDDTVYLTRQRARFARGIAGDEPDDRDLGLR